MLAKAIFLDRDGVLNESVIKKGKPHPPANLTELIIAPDVLPALQKLKMNGFLLIGATNQPDVARGVTDKKTVEEIHEKLLKSLPLDDIRVCYHDDHDGCLCRKPSPQLLLQAAKDYDIDLKQSIMIGDRWKDIEAGQRALCKTVWLRKDYDERAPQSPDFIAATLMEAADYIISLRTK